MYVLAVVGLIVVRTSLQLMTNTSFGDGYLNDREGPCGCKKHTSISSDSGKVSTTHVTHQNHHRLQ